MYPHAFADLTKSWMSGHPDVAEVHTCTEIGRHEQPAGVLVGCPDGWSWLVQLVSTAPDGGTKGARPDLPDDGVYRANRVAWERKRGGKVQRGTPGVKAGQVLQMVADAVRRAERPEVTGVEVAASPIYGPGARPCLWVAFADGARVIGYAVGAIAPGGTDLANAAHEVPAGWW